MKVSFAITVSNEISEIKQLISHILKHKRQEDEIVVLFDKKNGNPEVFEFLKNLDVRTHSSLDFNYDFASWKNKLNSYCTGDYIFQLDADELVSEYMIKNVHEIVSLNPETDLFFVPRVNTVEGITQDHINRWGWRVDDLGRINFPDYQGRIYKKGMEWRGKVHERIIVSKFYSLLPSDENEYCIQHHKTIDKQERQNNLYEKI